MRKSIFLLLFLAFVAKNEAFSQAKINLDSLVAYNDKYLKEDTVKVKMLIRLAEELKKSDTEKAIDYATRAITLSEQVKYDFWIGKSYYAISDIYFRTGDLKEAKLFCEKSRFFFEKGKYNDYLGTSIMRLGSIAARSRDFDNAIKFYDEAIIIFDKTKNFVMKTKVITGLATVSHDLGNYEKAIEYYNKAIELNKIINDKSSLLLLYINMSVLYTTIGKYPLALEYSQSTIKLAESLEDMASLASGYVNLGVVYFELNDIKESKKNYLKALDFHQKSNNKIGISRVLVNLLPKDDDDKLSIEENKKAIEDAKKAIEYCKKVGNKISLARAHQYLGSKYIFLKEYASAYFHNLEAFEIEKGTKEVRNTQLMHISFASILLNCSDSDLISFNIDPKKRYEKAKEYLDKNLENTKEYYCRENELTWQQFSILYEKMNDFPKAYDAYKKYIAIKDSISGDEVKKQITRKEIQYEYDKKETVLKYEQQLTTDQLEKQKLLTFQQNQTLTLKEQALALSNKEKDLAHLAYLKEQAEKQEKMQQLSLSEEREKGKERDLTLKNLELSAQQKQNLYLGLFSILLLGGLGTLLYFYNTLKKQKNIIAQQNELNEHTIAILSHDIKEPLLGVKLMLKKLNKDDPFVAQASQSLENQINSVNGILTNLLKMKKLSFAKKDKNVKANVKSVVQNVIQELNVAIQGKSLTINSELADDLMIPIAPEKLQIIVNNLLSNAVKYSFPNQSIRIFQEGNGFCIQDFGVGLSPEQRSKIMREVTASQQGTSQERGNGMGLFLVGAMLQGEQIKVIFDSPEVGGTIVKVLG